MLYREALALPAFHEGVGERNAVAIVVDHHHAAVLQPRLVQRHDGQRFAGCGGGGQIGEGVERGVVRPQGIGPLRNGAADSVHYPYVAVRFFFVRVE